MSDELGYTPAHEMANMDLLRLIPDQARRVIDIGCSSGALAREIKARNPSAWVHGVDISVEYASLAARHCDVVESLDIDTQSEDYFARHADKDVWVFGDTLEHLRDPWRVLRSIRRVLPAGGCVALCVPNAQHWSVQARLSAGLFRYEDSGLLDRTHLRWFTRKTLLEMVTDCGFEPAAGFPRVFDEPEAEHYLPIIGELAELCGADRDEAISDARPLQYVMRIVARS